MGEVLFYWSFFILFFRKEIDFKLPILNKKPPIGGFISITTTKSGDFAELGF